MEGKCAELLMVADRRKSGGAFVDEFGWKWQFYTYFLLFKG
jgi:hypothetical protein